MKRSLMKKTSLLAVTALLCSLLGACGASDSAPAEASDAPEAAASAATEAPAAQEEPVVLSMWTPQSPLVEDYATNKLTAWYEEKTGVHIEWTTVSQADMATEFNLSLASGDYPDVYLCNLTPEQIMLCAANEAIIPMEGLLETHGPNTLKCFEENPSYRDYLTAPDGHLYTLYYTDIGVHNFSKYKMFAYQPWLDQLQMEIPRTTEELKQMLIAFRDNDMNGNGDAGDEIPYTSSFATASGSPFYFLMNPFQLASESGFMVGEDGSVSVTFNTDGYREGLAYINDLYQEKLVDDALFVQDETQLKALVNVGEPENFLVGSFTGFVRQSILDQTVMEYFTYTTVPPLEGPTGLRQSATNGYGGFNPRCAITTACENPELAMEWLDYWMGEEGNMVQSFGYEEGVDYERNDKENYLGTTDTWDWLFDSTSLQNTILLNLGLPRNDTPYRRYSTPATYESTPMRLWEAAALYEPYYVNTGVPAIVWTEDEAVSEELSLLRATIDEHVKLASSEFVLGVRSLDTDWEAYLSELDAMGLPRYLELLTEVYA